MEQKRPFSKKKIGENVSAPACTNGVWPLLRLVSVVQKIKSSTMLSSNLQSFEMKSPWTARPGSSGQ